MLDCLVATDVRSMYPVVIGPYLAIKYGSQAMAVTSTAKPAAKGSIIVVVSEVQELLMFCIVSEPASFLRRVLSHPSLAVADHQLTRLQSTPHWGLRDVARSSLLVRRSA